MRARWQLIAAPLVSGLALAAADAPLGLAPLQLLALIPFFVAMRRAPSWAWAAAMGALLTLRAVCFIPALAGLPAVAWVAVPIYLALLHAAFGLACFSLRGLRPELRALGAGVAFVALEVFDAHMPMWGSALSLACSWSRYPSALAMIALTGPHMVAFALVATQSIAVDWRQARRAVSVVAVAALAALVVGFARSGTTHATSSLRVATLGWADPHAADELDGLVAKAAAQGARLIVTPEATFDLPAGERDAMLVRLKELARRYRVYLAVGYVDRGQNVNRIAFVDPSGSLMAEYTKTHLVPPNESTRPGDGLPVIVDVDGVKVGGMICQDDNFRDVAQRYARAGAQLVVTPTFEISPALGALHLRNALLRPIEGGFAYVRAVARGTSAIVSSDGEVQASYDHLQGGTAVLVADVRYTPALRDAR